MNWLRDKQVCYYVRNFICLENFLPLASSVFITRPSTELIITSNIAVLPKDHYLS